MVIKEVIYVAGDILKEIFDSEAKADSAVSAAKAKAKEAVNSAVKEADELVSAARADAENMVKAALDAKPQLRQKALDTERGRLGKKLEALNTGFEKNHDKAVAAVIEALGER